MSSPSLAFRPAALGMLLILTLVGCRTIPPPPAERAEVGAGQLDYRGPKRTFVAEFFLRRAGPADAQLDLVKLGGEPLLSLRLREDRLWATGTVAGPGWSGRADAAPRVLRGWAGLVRQLSSGEKTPALSHASPETGETFTLRFDEP